MTFTGRWHGFFSALWRDRSGARGRPFSQGIIREGHGLGEYGRALGAIGRAAGDSGQVRAFADSLMGSALLFRHPDRDPTRSINFVTAHDGFTLNDLVSYNAKHNLANGEDNRDGADNNDSWNGGAEGPTDDPAVDQLRLQQIKNFLMALFVSQGRPMVLMGDEVRRTQHGNNNAYCQDNETSWYDWDLTTGAAGLLRVVRGFLNFRKGLFLFTDRRFWGEPGSATVAWHGVDLGQPDFSDDSHTLALELSHPGSAEHLHIIFDAYWEALDFTLPDLPADQLWHRLVDTALRSPEDLSDPPQPLTQGQNRYTVGPRSTVILTAEQEPHEPARATYPQARTVTSG